MVEAVAEVNFTNHIFHGDKHILHGNMGKTRRMRNRFLRLKLGKISFSFSLQNMANFFSKLPS